MKIAKKLKKGASVMVIAPSRSLGIIGKEGIELATETLKRIGFGNVNFSKNVFQEGDNIHTGKVDDIHNAFADKNIDLILSAIGGYNSHEILSSIDYTLIRNNPKIICGFSDVTMLLNSIFDNTGLVTYYGPHFSTFGMQKEADYNIASFLNITMSEAENITLLPSETWSDDAWYINQTDRELIPNVGYKKVKAGTGSGILLGGHISCFQAYLLYGGYTTITYDIILFLEVDEATANSDISRIIRSILFSRIRKNIKGIVFGRLQKNSITEQQLSEILEQFCQDLNIPIMINANFGHVNPITTLPIGGESKLEINETTIKRTIHENSSTK